MTHLRRSLDDELDELLPHLPAIAIDGPKGVGKTATAARRVDQTISLDIPSNLALLESDFNFLSYEGKRLLLDEWQHYPQIWDMVRRRVDAGADVSYGLARAGTCRAFYSLGRPFEGYWV